MVFARDATKVVGVSEQQTMPDSWSSVGGESLWDLWRENCEGWCECHASAM